MSFYLQGNALGTNGNSSITLHPGTNLVGLPLKDSRITRVSDLLNLEGIRGNVPEVIISDNGAFEPIAQAGDNSDNPAHRWKCLHPDRSAGGNSPYLRQWVD